MTSYIGNIKVDSRYQNNNPSMDTYQTLGNFEVFVLLRIYLLVIIHKYEM